MRLPRDADRSQRRKCPRCDYQLYAQPIPRHARFHDLRHTAATLLLKAGVPLAGVQKILRHSDPKITTENYGHLELADVRKGLERLDFGDAALPPAPPTQPAEEAQPARAMVVNAEAFSAPTTAPILQSLPAGKTEAAAPSETRAMLRPCRVGATGFEPATTCTPRAAGSCTTVTRSSQLCGILRITAPSGRPRIARIHHASQRFCYQFATADRAAPHRAPGRAAAPRLHRDHLQMGCR